MTWLAERPRGSNEEAFDELYRTYYPRIVRYALRRTSRDEALDVAAETFTVAWVRLQDVPKDPGPWLYTVARNHLLHRGRLADRWTPTILRNGSMVIGDHSETVISVIAALASLTPRDRELLMLVAWDGLSPAECSRILNCTAATFAVRLHRARKRLERAMEPPDGSED